MSRFLEQSRKTLDRARRYFPLTFSGSILAVIALLFFTRSFATRDPYQLVLSLAALFVLGALIVIGRLQAMQFSKIQIQWDTSAPLFARRASEPVPADASQKLTGVALTPFLWYRLHFSLHGRLTVGRSSSMYVSHEVSTTGSREVPLDFAYPLCGTLDASGYLSIVDIFGLTRSRFGLPFKRKLAVQPAPFPETISVHVEAAERTEEKQSQLASDEDKYYMREYAPGDRFRDINWKTSSRLLQLYTRISPVAQEQSKIIGIDFRHFRDAVPETLDSVAHLNHIKSWLLTFLRTVKEENRDFHFHITTGRGLSLLQTAEDVERFADELAGFQYQSDPGHLGELANTDEIYIFTTPYDIQLPALLARYPQKHINLFRTLSSTSRAGSRRRTFALLDPSGNLPLPGWWALRRDRNLPQPGVEHSGVRIIGQEVVEPRLA